MKAEPLMSYIRQLVSGTLGIYLCKWFKLNIVIIVRLYQTIGSIQGVSNCEGFLR